jgi:pyrroloquinoline quinone (PQQ) biosynthesis protein C
MSEEKLAKLKERLDFEMDNLQQSPNLFKVLEEGFADKRLYGIYLTETYHYTFHNSRNQAAVATRKEIMNINYIKYCLKHSLEEAGHEMMAFHDLKNLGFDCTVESLPKPLNSTQALIAYLYYVAENENPVARLGYSFWAERSYEYIKPLLDLLSSGLNIEKKSMTFFNEHSEIDEQHAIDVENAIKRFAKTDQDWQDVEDCMVNSLVLTARMLDEVLEEFIKVKEEKKSRYGFLG